MKRKTGDYDKDVDLCEKIIKKYQRSDLKDFNEQIQKLENLEQGCLSTKGLLGDIKDCEQMIFLSVKVNFYKWNFRS